MGLILAPTPWAGAQDQGAASSEDLAGWKTLAETGDAAAQCRMGAYYSEAVHGDRDLALARSWLERAAGQGYAEAQRRLGEFYDFADPALHDATEAARWYALAAGQGDAAAEYRLGRLYVKGAGLPRDVARGLAMHRRAADKGHAPAQVDLGDRYRTGDGVPVDPSEVLRYYNAAAAQGDAVGQLRLGYYVFEQGLDGAAAIDKAQALALFLKAAHQGLAEAQNNVGNHYARGVAVQQDCALADEWYRRAAAQGHVEAMYNLAHVRGTFVVRHALDGKCTAATPEESVRWLRQAAEAGHAGACTDLGITYTQGSEGIPMRREEAVQWLLKGAELGNAMAQAGIGWKYAHGAGVVTDYAKAVKWQRLSAGQGNAIGLCELGHLYERRWGVPQNDVEALRLYQQAAELGRGDCQYSLGILLRDARGAARDLVASFVWFSLADRDETPEAKEAAEDVRRLLTAAQIAEAELRLAQWKSPPE